MTDFTGKKNCLFDSTCPKAVNSSGHPACNKSICTIKDQLFVFGQGIGQRESFFQSRDENESFSDSISFIETRPRIPDAYSQALRRDREKISSNLGHRDENEIFRCATISWFQTVTQWVRDVFTASASLGLSDLFIFVLRLRDEYENSLDLILVFDGRTRILKVAIQRWNLSMPSVPAAV